MPYKKVIYYEVLNYKLAQKQEQKCKCWWLCYGLKYKAQPVKAQLIKLYITLHESQGSETLPFERTERAYETMALKFRCGHILIIRPFFISAIVFHLLLLQKGLTSPSISLFFNSSIFFTTADPNGFLLVWELNFTRPILLHQSSLKVLHVSSSCLDLHRDLIHGLCPTYLCLLG